MNLNHPEPLVTIAILNWNRKDDLVDAIDSALEQTYNNFEVLVVDNNSNDGSYEYVKNIYSKKINLVRLDKNYGCPGGRNHCIENAHGEFIYFLDNDGLLDKNALERAMQKMISSPHTAVVSSKTVYYSTKEDRFLYSKHKDMEMMNESFYAAVFSGGASLHRVSIYDKVGVYPDDFMYGGEEKNLSLRIIDSGFYIIYEPRSIMYHKISQTARNRKAEMIYRTSNDLVTYWQLMPLEIALSFTVYSLPRDILNSIKNNIVLELFIDTPRRISRLFETLKKRKPIKRNTLALIYTIESKNIKNEHELSELNFSYFSYLKNKFRTCL